MSGRPRLAQCPRDHAIVLVAEVAGLTIAVDSAPLVAQGFANAVVSGVGLWRLTKGPEGTSGRLDRPPGSWNPSWGPNGAQTGSQSLHAEHSCGVLHRDMRVLNLEGPAKGPQWPSATSGGLGGGNPPGPVPAGASRALGRPSPAPPATHRRSRPPRCGVCDRLIAERESYWGFEHPPGVWVYAEHEECP